MEAPKKRVRFSETSTLPRVGKKTLIYEAGQEYTLRADRANRWIKRSVAVEVPMPPAGAAEPEPKAPAPKLEDAELDRVATDIVAGKFDLDYAAPQMATHYQVDEKQIREQITARVEKLKPQPDEAAQQSGENTDTTKGPSDGNTVGSAADVGGQDGGDTRVGAGHVAGSRRGGSRGGRAGGGGQSHA